MSKFGLRAGGKEIYEVKSAEQALELIEMVSTQFFGEFWTQHKPRCPLCNEELSDHERHMNRPVGECTNDKCESTIYVGDYLGKIKDVLAEWQIIREQIDEAKKKEEEKKENKQRKRAVRKAGGRTHQVGQAQNVSRVQTVQGEPVFVW
jgi:uncharacterized protein with PIN domain